MNCSGTKMCWKKLEISPALPPKIEVRDFCAAQHEDRWEAGAVATGWEQIPDIPRSNQLLWVKNLGPGNRRVWVGWYIIYYILFGLFDAFFCRLELPMIFGNFNGLWVPQRWPLSDSVFGHGLSLERSVPSMIRWRENPEELHIWCLSLLRVFL